MKVLVELIMLPIVWGAYFIALFLLVMWKIGFQGMFKICIAMIKLAWIPFKIFLAMFGILTIKHSKHY